MIHNFLHYAVMLLRLFIAPLFPLLELNYYASFSLALFLCLYFGVCHFVPCWSFMCFHFIQCAFPVGHRERDPSTMCMLQHIPILLVNIGTILTQHPFGHRVVINPWVFLLPLWLELQLFFCNGTFAARKLSRLCIFWQCSWWNFRSGQLWLCGIRIITLWPITVNILPLLAGPSQQHYGPPGKAMYWEPYDNYSQE